jgi:hypothetical protein
VTLFLLLRSNMLGAVLVHRSLPDGEAGGIKRIGAQVHLVAVVIAIAVGIRRGGVRAESGFVCVREAVIVGIDA